MALKKSELYSALWSACDDLRGGMDASQYKDYVLFLLFIRYVSDKYKNDPYPPVVLPDGTRFADIVALKGKPNIGEGINTIIAKLVKANDMFSTNDFADFDSAELLGTGKEKVDRVTNLVTVFENPALDFSKNRAADDDILGDAYEYLMRHFATESGKSKGQFYTPAEVSRLIAQLLGVRDAKTTRSTSAYDPTCGSGSLLLKVADEAPEGLTLNGQEKDVQTAALARMNMILHGNAEAVIKQGNTLAAPYFTDTNGLKQFDFVVANPPFSDKRWSTGLDPTKDQFERFKFGAPPAKQGDYAYLLHILRSMKSTGKGACILPHGVLFRGNTEAAIRKRLLQEGYISAVIGLPPNLFFGTGIPACIVVLDKQNHASRKGVYLVDASAGFIKDGPKNRLRDRDVHRIVDAFARRADVPRFARTVGLDEIERNDFNLNLPRYIDAQPPEDVHDIDAHLRGGIPEADVAALADFWEVCPGLKSALFKPLRAGYVALAVPAAEVRAAVFAHPEFTAFVTSAAKHFDKWSGATAPKLKALAKECKPKRVIPEHAEALLKHYEGRELTDAYAVYQHLMDYWTEVMQDDCYLVAAGGWCAETSRVIEIKNGKEKDRGWTCDLVPKELVVARYFAKEQAAIDDVRGKWEAASAKLTELEEEHGGEDGPYAELEKVNKGNVQARLRELKADTSAEADEIVALQSWLDAKNDEEKQRKKCVELECELDQKALAKYPTLTEDEVRVLVVDDKWLSAVRERVRGETDRACQHFAGRVRELAERYAAPLPALAKDTSKLEAKVRGHLQRMGFQWQ